MNTNIILCITAAINTRNAILSPITHLTNSHNLDLERMNLTNLAYKQYKIIQTAEMLSNMNRD